jgi:hypothetical protein
MDDGPFIQSALGVENKSRMQCVIKTTLGVIDPVPGRPSASMYVDQVVGYQPDGTPIIVSDVLLNGGTELTNVYRQTRVRFEFDDIMNVATLLNPATGDSPNIDIELDEDGDLLTLDRTPIDGTLTYFVDLELLSTSLYFVSDVPLPSAGPNAPLNPRRIVLTLPPSVQDLVANPISGGGGLHSFITELPQLGEVLVPDGGEDFQLSWPDPNSNEDGPRSGAFWGGGRLARGVGGGSGRLGDLRVPSGKTLVLNTDSQSFPLGTSDGLAFNHNPDFLGNADAANFPDTLGNYPDSVLVSDGVFEFQSLTLESGSNLVFVGTQPARVYIRGSALLSTGSLVNLSGPQPPDHDSSVLNPETELTAPTPVAGGGDGGFGGDRFDMSVNEFMGGLGLCENDVAENPGADTRGRSGMGVGRSVGLGGGVGGVQYPTNYPTTNTNTTADNNNHGLGFNRVVDYNPPNFTDTECRSLMVGGVGSGGAYALDGGVGTSDAVVDIADYPFGLDNGAPNTPGGDSSWLEAAAEDNVGYNQRLLNWWDGFLRGGSGGGGGGNHPNGTITYRPVAGGTNCIGTQAFFQAWHDHSGAMGGTGGGALHLTAGKSLTVDGRIEAKGGQGGQARIAQSDFVCQGEHWSVDFGQFATPGGGGSGGSVKLQSMVVDISSTAGTIDISGGLGGIGVWSLSQGGVGSPGLLRVEDMVGGVNRSLVAQSVLPYDPMDDSLSWISVDNGQDSNDGPGWISNTHRPDSLSASMSCWLQPTGTFFSLYFVDDEEDDNTGDPDNMGWNMDILYNPGGTGEITIPFRGDNGGALGGNSWENEFGISLGTQGGLVAAAPIVIRFQGARTNGTTDLCNGDVNNLFAGIDPNSVTPWVDHPALFNDFPLAPNMIRFAVVFDGTSDGSDVPGDVLADVVGLTNLRVRVIPD